MFSRSLANTKTGFNVADQSKPNETFLFWGVDTLVSFIPKLQLEDYISNPKKKTNVGHTSERTEFGH